jgi:PAS domain S-box-containing protein
MLSNRNTREVWQSSASAAVLIVVLCSIITLFDITIFNHTTDNSYALSPATAVMFLCSALVTGYAIWGRWLHHLIALSIGVFILSIDLLFLKPNSADLLAGFTAVQSIIWFMLLAGWGMWHLPKYGKFAMLLVNLLLFPFSLWLVFGGLASQVTLLGFNPLTALNNAVLLSLITTANIAFNLSYPKRMQYELRSVGFVLSVFIALSVVVIWFDNTNKLQLQMRIASESVPAKLQKNIDDLVTDQQQLLVRLARRAMVLDRNFSEQYFQIEANSYLTDFPYMEYLAISDINAKRVLSAAETPYIRDWFNKYLPQRLFKIRNSLASNSSEVVFFVDYDANIDHSIMYVFFKTLYTDEISVVSASINYQLALNKLFDNILLDKYPIRINQALNNLLLFESADYPDYCIRSQKFVIRVHDAVIWQVSSCNILQNLPSSLLISAQISLYVGFLAILLAVLLQQLERKSRRHHARLTASNTKLVQILSEQQQLKLNYQQIMDNSADVICTIDTKGCFLELSPSAELVFGYPIKELIGKSSIEFVYPADRNRTIQEAEKIQSGKITLNFRNRYIRNDGSIVHLLWSSRYIKDVALFHAIAHDISELVRQETFQASQQFILKLISTDQSINDIFYHICSMAQEYIAGLKSSLAIAQDNKLKLIAAPAFSLTSQQCLTDIEISPDSLPCGLAAYEKNLVVCEDIRLHPHWQSVKILVDEESVRANWSMPLVLSHGQVLGTFALYSSECRGPATEELELMVLCCRFASIAIENMLQRQALQESEQRYRSLYEFNPDPVYSLDLAGNFVQINNAGAELLELHKEQIIGQHYSKLILPGMIEQVGNYFAAAVNGTAQQYEVVLQGLGDTTIDFHITNLPIVVDGQVVGVFGIGKNVTERNRTATALKQSLARVSIQSLGLQGLNNCSADIHRDWDNTKTLRFVINELRWIMHCKQASVLITDSRLEEGVIWHTSVVDGYQAITERQAHNLLSQLEDQFIDGFIFDSSSIYNSNQSNLGPELSSFLLQKNTIVASPITDREGAIIGCLLVIDNDNRKFHLDDLLLTQQFAKLIYSALEYRQLLQSMTAAECDLQRELQFNTAVTNSMSDILLVTDMAGRVSFLNPSAHQLLEQTDLTVTNRVVSEILPINPDSWKAGCFYEVELELRVKQKLTSYICKTTPLRTFDEQAGWLVTLHDISAERRADAISQERDQFFTLSLELFCLVDLNGCFVQVNPAFSRVLEFDQADLIGQSYLRVIDERDHQLFTETLMHLAQGSDINDLEFRVVTKTDKVCWLQLSASLSDDIIFCAARNITERKSAEKQLEQTLQELKRSNEELNEFAYVASHDLQEPLRKIRTFGDRLLQKISPDDVAIQDYALRMKNAAERMQCLINDLLTYSKLNADTLVLTKINMSALAQDVITMFDEVISHTGAQIKTDFNVDITGDERQLRQLLQNLLSNALKFHKTGQPALITLSTQQVTDGIRLTVLDFGIGFEPQYIEKIFNPFQRLHGRSMYAGAGIGLSIVKKVAEKHAASIEVIAKKGEGACFNITFPDGEKPTCITLIKNV